MQCTLNKDIIALFTVISLILIVNDNAAFFQLSYMGLYQLVYVVIYAP